MARREDSFVDRQLTATKLAVAGCLAVLVLRIPSFFEPAWHTDEGTFAGVAQGLLHGRGLYSQAWESKPPLFLLSYAGIFKLLGTGVWQPKLAAALAAITTQLIVFLIGRHLMSNFRALVASVLTGVILAVPFWDGNLALSEVLSLPFECAAVLIAISRFDREGTRGDAWQCLAGGLFGAAFLMRQPAILALPCVAVWLIFAQQPSVRRLGLLGFGASVPLLLAGIIFAFDGSFAWFWNANVSYFFYYIPTGNRLTDALLPFLFLPLLVTLALLLVGHLRRQAVPVWALPALWYSAAFIGSLLNGKDYSHYLLLTAPPLMLLLAALWPGSLRLSRRHIRWEVFTLALVVGISWFAVVGNVYGDPLGRHWTKGLNYYGNFLEYATHRKSRLRYEAFFDKRTETTVALDALLGRIHAQGKSAYIWGEYPWVYALADLTPFSRYVTSYYILEDDERGSELMTELSHNPPSIIVIASDAEPRPDRPPTKERYALMLESLEAYVAGHYRLVGQAGAATVFELPGPLPAAVTTSHSPTSAQTTRTRSADSVYVWVNEPSGRFGATDEEGGDQFVSGGQEVMRDKLPAAAVLSLEHVGNIVHQLAHQCRPFG